MLARNSSHNTRRLLNATGAPNPVITEVAISFDAETAFDRVEWEYLYYALAKFGFRLDNIYQPEQQKEEKDQSTISSLTET